MLHRLMQLDFKKIRSTLSVDIPSCISYSQLKRLLKSLDYKLLNEINASHFGFSISHKSGEWKSIDGKELRGTIDGLMGEKRGQTIVNVTNHQSGLSLIVGEFDGKKASEKVVVSDYLRRAKAEQSEKITFDALHTSVANLEVINLKEDFYLAQVKLNQKVLYHDCEDISQLSKDNIKIHEVEKGHGRVDDRLYNGYSIDLQDLHKRWKSTGICSLIVVKKRRYVSKTGKESQEISHWVSNQPVDNESIKELSKAIRNHWSVEVHHNRRDVQWGEDKMVIRNKIEAKVMAGFITVADNLVQKQNENGSALREKLARNWSKMNHLFHTK